MLVVFMVHFSCLPATYVFCALPLIFHLVVICSFCDCISVVLQLIVKTSRVFMSTMPNKTWPFPGTTNYSHISCLLLHLIFTLHMLNCVIFVLLYILEQCLYFCCRQLFFCCPGKYNFEYVDWHYISITACVDFLWGSTVVLWLDEVFFIHYYWLFAMKNNGIYTYCVSLVVISCLLFYFMHCEPLCHCYSCTVLWGGLFSLRVNMYHMLDTVDMGGWNHSNHSFTLVVLVLWKMVLHFAHSP